MKIEFKSENKQSTGFDFPKLMLDHGERARIVCIEPTPEAEFVHTLKAPIMGADGQPEMETVRSKSGDTSSRVKTKFIGRHICLGDLNIVSEKGKDPQGCPTCQASQQEDAFEAPQRRFAMHVVQYKTQTGGFKIQTPFNASLVVWTFTDRVFNTLVDIMEEHGDLRQKDLLLGPCENKMYQNFDIQVGGTAEWLTSEANQTFVKTLYAENKLESLQPAIARKVNRDLVMEDIHKVRIAHAQVYGDSSGADVGSGAAAASSVSLDALLANDPATAAEPTPPVETTTPEPTPPVTDLPPTPDAPVTETPAAAPVEEEKPPAKTFDFDSLLNGL